MTQDPTPIGSPDFTILSLSYDRGVARIAVSQTLLHRAPWFREAIETVVWIGGTFWPDNIRLITQQEYDASLQDLGLLFVPEWVFSLQPPEPPLEKIPWRFRIFRLALRPAFHKIPAFGHDPAAYGAFLLADALYQQLESRGMALCDVFGREQFRNDAYFVHYAPHFKETSKGCWAIFAVTWLLLVMFPLFLAMQLYNAVQYLLLRVLLLVLPRNHSIRMRIVRLRRGFRRLAKIPAETRSAWSAAEDLESKT